MIDHTTLPTSQQRPLVQFNLFTVFVGFASLSIMLAINLNGVCGPGWYTQSTNGYTDIVDGLLYGWPMTFYAKAEEQKDLDSYFVAEAFAVDCVVAATLVFATLVASELILRRWMSLRRDDETGTGPV